MAKNGNFRLLLLQVTQADYLTDLCMSRGIQWPRLAISDYYCYRSHRQIKWQMYPYPKYRHLLTKNGNFRLLLLQVIQVNQMADLPTPVEASSGQEWKFQISIAAGHIGRSTGRSTSSSRGILWPRMAISDCYCYRSYRQIKWQIYPLQQRHLVAKNGNFRFLLLQVIQADQLADLPPPVEASSVQEWQFQIAIVTGHIGRSTGRFSPTPSSGIYWSRMAISDCYCYRSYRQINWQMYPPVEIYSGQE